MKDDHVITLNLNVLYEITIFFINTVYHIPYMLQCIFFKISLKLEIYGKCPSGLLNRVGGAKASNKDTTNSW